MINPAVDPVPSSAYPSFQPVTGAAPQMSPSWACTALLHPFSPPFSSDPTPNTPFFQLCIANIVCSSGNFLSAQIAGCIYGTWWYVITPSGTRLSTDQGTTWTSIDIGWSVPQDWFGAQAPNAACAGSSPLNWMSNESVDWWKVPVPIPASPPAATWMWFDSASQNPVRMMFGYGPPLPTKGDPTQLALFQMFSFTYFPQFETPSNVSIPGAWSNPAIEGFSVGNPYAYQAFVWNSNFGMTALMTPVNENFNPLPTRVLYVWKGDQQYQLGSDRAQNTLMQYNYNPGNIEWEEALLFGRAPAGEFPPISGGFIITKPNNAAETCRDLPFPQEPPNWISVPAAQATIQATIVNNPVLCPDVIVTIYSVLFPPATPNYPEATYLWTWYVPTASNGVQSQPVTFMQSQSGVNLGTSLALADYFYYQEFATPIDPSNFGVPVACADLLKKRGGGG